jgi:putative membrane protein
MNAKKILIIIISVLIPLVIAFLFIHTNEQAEVGGWVHRLPHLNAMINGLTAIILITGVLLIKDKNESGHRLAMGLAFVLGFVFMVSYIIYHASVPSTVFGDTNHDKILDDLELAALGGQRIVYLTLLLSHILFAVIALPLVLMAVYYALSDNRKMHKKIVKFTFPIWLFVAVSGVAVYFMISPYY